MESGQGMSSVAEQRQENGDVSQVVSDNGNNATSSVNPAYTESCNVSASVNTSSNDNTSSDERKLFVGAKTTVAEQLQENSDMSQVVSDNGNTATSSVNPVYTESCNVSASVNTPSNDHTSSDERKLFVGGMHWVTGEKELRKYFGQFGEIEHIKLISDQLTGCSRGYAFIVFKSDEAIHKVEAVSDHVINGRKVNARRARRRQCKIYVGSLTPDITDEDIKSHFAQFGTIVEAQMPYDTFQNRRRGFCFIIYESEEVVKNVLRMPKHIINGKKVTVKTVVPKPGINSGVRGGRGGFGAPGFNSGYGGVLGGRGVFVAPGFNSGNGGGFIHDNWQSYDPIHSDAQNIIPGGASFGSYSQRYQPY